MKGKPFQELPLYASFRHNGQTYLKLGRNMARNEWRQRTVFPGEMVVELLEGGFEGLRVCEELNHRSPGSPSLRARSV